MQGEGSDDFFHFSDESPEFILLRNVFRKVNDVWRKGMKRLSRR